MIQKWVREVCLLGVMVVGCSAPVDEAGIDPADVKPEDGSALEGSELGSTQQPHTLHYTDATNQWLETSYPMGADNPNCKDWWVYDRYLSSRPAVGSTSYSTYQTSHKYAQGTYVNQMMASIPWGSNYDVWKQILVDHNSVVARSNGRCSGRYVFQWDNRTGSGPFERTFYWVSANIPSYLLPPNETWCKSQAADLVPATLIDLYVFEAPNNSSVTSVSSWCSKTAGNWRKYGSSIGTGYWTASTKTCYAGTGIYYQPPSNKVAVSFNMVVKAGIGHGVAPAEIYVVRY
jgi:hypothetical protein